MDPVDDDDDNDDDDNMTMTSNEEHGITFIPGGPAGTMALNETHHLTPFGTVVEALNSTHHLDEAGVMTSNVAGNLTREHHGLTDEHLDAHAADGTDHALHDFFAGATYLVPQTETGTPAGHLHERCDIRLLMAQVGRVLE